jgi:DNA-binding PadR family transcriptional regulator
MLSKTALLILGVIADEPINPYAISKLISYKRRNLRGKIPDPTVYGIINMLHEKNLIKGKKVKNGNLPDRTVYSITQKGKDLLNKNLIAYLSTPEDTLSELPLALFLMGSLEKEQVQAALKQYQTRQAEEIATMVKMVESEKKRGVPYSGLIAIQHILNFLKVNLNTVNELLLKIERDTDWSHHPVPFWRAEFAQQTRMAAKK